MYKHIFEIIKNKNKQMMFMLVEQTFDTNVEAYYRVIGIPTQNVTDEILGGARGDKLLELNSVYIETTEEQSENYTYIYNIYIDILTNYLTVDDYEISISNPVISD